MKTYTHTEVEQFLQMLGHRDADGCTEIRILTKSPHLHLNGRREYVGNTVAGYYTDYEKAARDIACFDGHANIYATLNPCDPTLMRRADNKLLFKAKHAASDKDILAVHWFPYDTDPVRPADTPASLEELQAALERRDRIIREVFEPLGVPVLRGMSGNGGHGLIRLIGYPNDAETQAKLKRLLDYLAERYSDDKVSVDRTVGNPSRIWKVYGTLAVKGDNTPSAPYRRAYIDLPDTPIEPFDLLAILDQIVPPDWQAAKERTHQTTGGRRSDNTSDYPFLDVERYLSHYGHGYTVKHREGRTLYVLEHCLFNPDHNGADAALIQEANGQMGYHCFHNSCSDKTWQDAKEAIGDPLPFFQHTRNGNGTTNSGTKGATNAGRSGSTTSQDSTANHGEQKKAKAKQHLAKIAQTHVFRGDDQQTALSAMQRVNEERFQSALSVEEMEAISADELSAFMPTVMTAQALRATKFPEPRWAVPGFVAQGVTLLAGRPKMGKSYLALNLALAVGHGGKALSRIDCTQGRVLYASGVTEGSFPEFQERLNQILDGDETPETVDFVEDMPRLDKGGVGFLRHWARIHPDARLIILDTLAAFAPQKTRSNSNDYADSYDVMGMLKQIAKEFNLAILVITHTNKTKDHEWALDAVMGSTGNTGATDATLVMSKKGSDFILETFGRRIKNEKYAIKPNLALGLWELMDGNADAHLMSQQRQAIIDVLRQGHNEPASPSEIADRLEKFSAEEKGAVRKLCWQMKQAGILETVGNGRGSKYKLMPAYYKDETGGNSGNANEEYSDTADLGDLFRYRPQSNSGNGGNEKRKTSDHVDPFRYRPQSNGNESGNGQKYSAGEASDVFVTSVTSVTSETPEENHDPDFPSEDTFLSDSDIENVPDEPRCELAFIKNAYAEYGNAPTPVEKLIRPAQLAGYDLTFGNRSPIVNLKQILSTLKGKRLDDLKFYETGDGIYSIATCRNGRERYVI